MNNTGNYKYKPVLFFALAYVFTWIFWIPAIFLPESISPLLMLIGLMAPAIVSTVFIMASGSDLLKQDFKNKIIGFYKVKWLNVVWAVIVFAIVIVCSILLSLLFGQSIDQFSFTESFSFTGVGIAGAFWSFWHFPLIFIQGTYQAGLMVNPLYVINFFVSGIPMGFVITWVYLESDRSILACMIFHFFVNFMQEKIALTPETKCLETIVITVLTIIIVMAKKDMFFETRHVGRLLEYSNNSNNEVHTD